MTSHPASYDAVIIGGGPAGSTAAILLARAGWSVAIIEKAKFPRGKVCGEFLSATTMPLLRDLGIFPAFLDLAGPEVRRVGVFAGNRIVCADMPRASGGEAWGRAVGREHLDAMLLTRAKEAGAVVWQPWIVKEVAKKESGYICTISGHGTRLTLRANAIIAAHGSWELGSLPTHLPRLAPRGGDLFGFKAHFRGATLPPGLMSLLCFPGGYGGMVETDHGRLSFSCCIRRDCLDDIRRHTSSSNAAGTVLRYIEASCAGVREALADADVEGDWLAVGPIRPGIRARSHHGIFLIGNTAGEAHPVVAEGISMAIQSAWILCEQLVARQDQFLAGRGVPEVGRDYAATWRKSFAARIHAASCIAHLAMRPAAVVLALTILRTFPAVLTWGAARSGKVNAVMGCAS